MTFPPVRSEPDEVGRPLIDNGKTSVGRFPPWRALLVGPASPEAFGLVALILSVLSWLASTSISGAVLSTLTHDPGSSGGGPFSALTADVVGLGTHIALAGVALVVAAVGARRVVEGQDITLARQLCAAAQILAALTVLIFTALLLLVLVKGTRSGGFYIG